jgi:hypothetical protein
MARRWNLGWPMTEFGFPVRLSRGNWSFVGSDLLAARASESRLSRSRRVSFGTYRDILEDSGQEDLS